MADDIKQVIIVRRDLNMRKGKIASQVAHASMGIFFSKLKSKTENVPHYTDYEDSPSYVNKKYWILEDLPYFEEFITGKFKKIVVYVNSEEELLAIYSQAQEAGIHSSLIKDAGLTEFGGVATYTTVGIGPWKSSEIDKITGNLKLL